MSEKLDKFKPNRNDFAMVKRQLVAAGVEPDQIPEEWVIATMAAMAKWVSTTDEGFNYISNLLEFDFTKGDDSKQYGVDTGIEVFDVDANDICFVRGAIAGGRPVASSRLHWWPKVTSECQSCGVVKHCVKDVHNPITGEPMGLCNHCTCYHEHPRVNDYGDFSKCSDCPVVDCSHHPKRGGVGT